VKRIGILIALIALVVWLGSSRHVVQASALAAARPALAGQAGETSPYYVCEGRMCAEQSGCGVSQCGSDQDCGACDPYQRDECIYGRQWDWDDWSCTCSPPQCDPAGEQECAAQWGTWDSSNCYCDNPCNPRQAQILTSWQTDPYFIDCIDCGVGLFETSGGETWVQYCQDGRLWDDWESSYQNYYQDWSWNCFNWWWCWWLE